MITGSTAIALLEDLQDEQLNLSVAVKTGDNVTLDMKHRHTYQSMLESVKRVVEGGFDQRLILLCQDGKHYPINGFTIGPDGSPYFTSTQLYNNNN